MTPLETIYKIAKDGCDIRIVCEDTFKIMGFYKHGSITVNVKENWYSTRYTDNIKFKSDNLFQELLDLNYACWIDYRDRYSGWQHMESPWHEYYVDFMSD